MSSPADTRTTTILGVYQSDFSTSLKREGRAIDDLVREVVCGTLAAAEVEPAQVESIHVGNAFGQLYTGQGHLGAMPATVVPELWGTPAMRHEAACASGSIATLAAMAEIEAARYDCILVLGVEQERTLPGLEAAEVQAAAAHVGHETGGPELIWPAMFDRIADEYERRYGIDELHLRAIGELNLNNAKQNPRAQTRGWQLGPEHFAADDEANPVVAGRLRRNDCCQITDGGAGILVVSQRWLAEQGRLGEGARIAGWGHRTVGLPLAPKLERSRQEPYVMPHVRRAITDAWRRAGISGVEALDGIETHDCMTPSEYLAIDHFGITPPGQSWQAVEEGALQRDGRMPINASGGLIGGGHPVGATGVRMLVDAASQVCGRAGDTQIEGATRMATLNIGGSTATTVSFVVERGERVERTERV
jgi:acetyl-CoA C-acetyltransferase